MKTFPLWWLNIFFVVAYAVVALFVDSNGQLLGMSAGSSKFVLHALVVGGVAVALISLFKSPKQWLVPVLCLIVYLAFVL